MPEKDKTPEKADKHEQDALEGLVKVKKEGELRHVHPTTLKEHLAEGWKHA